jgi:hypothetical protein
MAPISDHKGGVDRLYHRIGFVWHSLSRHCQIHYAIENHVRNVNVFWSQVFRHRLKQPPLSSLGG